jgi:AcrR family transcriptional regulator
VAYRRTPQIQARLDSQRETILVAAAELLAESGYSACSVAAVAARAGVAAGTVYKHFAGKSELAAELFRRVVSREVAAVHEAVTLDAPVTERAAAVVETFAGRALKSPRLAYALLVEPVAPEIEALRLEFRVAFRDVIAEVIADGVASGELPPQPSVVVASALVGAIGEALAGPLSGQLSDGHVDPDVIPTLITFTHRALGVSNARHA